MTKKLTFLVFLCTLLLFANRSPAWADPAIPPDPPLRWWKGNLHTHSLWSDGNDFPEMIAQWYCDHGYHFLALSDHNVLSQGVKWIKTAELKSAKRRGRWKSTWRGSGGIGWKLALTPTVPSKCGSNPWTSSGTSSRSSGRFLMIPSEEISDKVGKIPVHLNAANLRDLIEPLGGKTVREAIAEQPPRRRGTVQKNRPRDPAPLEPPEFSLGRHRRGPGRSDPRAVLRGLQRPHRRQEPGDAHRAGTEEIWDVANTLRLARLDAPPLYGVAVDDSHDYEGTGPQRPGRGWVMVRARHLTPESLIRAMKAGDFYASSGVVLRDVRYDDDSRAA